MSSAGHGPNIGHGYVKYVVIDKEGNELPPVVFPAMISRAGRSVAGAIARVDTVSAGGAQWWTGEDALLAPSPLTILAQERLSDTAFVPAMLRSALQRLGNLNGASIGLPTVNQVGERQWLAYAISGALGFAFAYLPEKITRWVLSDLWNMWVTPLWRRLRRRRAQADTSAV